MEQLPLWIVAGVFIFVILWDKYSEWQKKPKVPKESLRSLIAEGVITVEVKRVDYDRFHIKVKSPFPIKQEVHQNYLVLSYIDGSSRTVINDKNLGNDALTV